MGTTPIAVEPLSFSKIFLLVLVERPHKGVQKSWQSKNRGLPRFDIRTSLRDKSEELINFDKGRKPQLLACFQEDFQRPQLSSARPSCDALQSFYWWLRAQALHSLTSLLLRGDMLAFVVSDRTIDKNGSNRVALLDSYLRALVWMNAVRALHW